MNLQQLSKEERREMSFIEIARHIFEEKKQAISFQEIVSEIQSFLDLPDEEFRKRMVQFYTDLNVDGSFMSLGDNRWGLREWYPYDQIDEEVITPVKPKKKKAKKALDEDDLLEDEDDFGFDDEEDDFDDEDDDEIEEESLEVLREEEEEDFEEEEEGLLEDDEYEIDEEEEDLEIDDEDELEEEEEEGI